MDIKKILHKGTKGRNRKRALEAGAYDGRFNTKIVPDKKKEKYKKLRKNKNKLNEFY